jgi:hypothetical protein
MRLAEKLDLKGLRLKFVTFTVLYGQGTQTASIFRVQCSRRTVTLCRERRSVVWPRSKAQVFLALTVIKFISYRSINLSDRFWNSLSYFTVPSKKFSFPLKLCSKFQAAVRSPPPFRILFQSQYPSQWFKIKAHSNTKCAASKYNSAWRFTGGSVSDSAGWLSSEHSDVLL